MLDAAKFDLREASPIIDPTTGSGEVYLFPQGMGQDGAPFVFMVEDPPLKTRARHYHHGDVLYLYVKGEHHIEGEGTYRAGDVRWTRGGYAYGPETTGPEGGAWWVISYSDPIPVNVEPETASAEPPAAPRRVRRLDGELPRFAAPYDWAAIDDTVRTVGGAILKALVSKEAREAVNRELDAYLARSSETAQPNTGSGAYDMFLGHKTLRLHGLVTKAPSSVDLIGCPDIVGLAERIIGDRAASVLLNAGELIQIQSGEPAQFLHRDTDSWMDVPIEAKPVLVNVIVAMDDFTLENGATYIAPDSWRWDRHRQPTSDEFARAVMSAGDAVVFRGDLIHGGGENNSGERRRALSLSYCAGWLRSVENSFLNVPPSEARKLPEKVQALLGYALHDGVSKRGGLLGLYEGGSPRQVLA